jgi:hypothetical protein
MRLTILAAGALALCAIAFPFGADDPVREFESPPAASRPWVYWFIMDGNFSREGITADLEAMQRAGIGGAILMEVDVGIPRGPVRFMSEEWRAFFKHAVSEAERLGLEITLNAGPGWTGSGGPWVRPEQSMQLLVASAVDVSGPGRFAAVLPRPESRKPYFGEKGLPPELVRSMREFYRDAAVLAVPKTPAGLVDGIDEKALYLRHPYSSKPGTKPYLPEPPRDPGRSGSAIRRDRVVDLTQKLASDGRLEWEVPAGDWTILRFGSTSNGANTRPAPFPGLGLECDKFETAALDEHFRNFIGVLLADLGPRPSPRASGWNMLHIDSWEMGAQNWSAGFREEFRRRRGYDPLLFLPAYTGRLVENLEITERFLWDVRLTAQELVVANHAEHLRDLAHRNGFGLSIEPYDMNPAADLALGGVADVPMCEFWSAGDGFETTFSCIEAVSIAHTRGRSIVASESFTGAGKESWTRHPASMKNQADWALCAGINRIVFHRYAHQPWLDRAPGMTMGPYGTQYERTQTWWEFSRPWHDYLARCQNLLRRGLPVADVLYLAPEGAPHVFRAPVTAFAGSSEMPDRRGYNFDACDPGTLLSRASVRDGRIVFPDGMSYGILVLPQVERMTPQLLAKIKALLTEGAVVAGSPVRKAPGLSGYPQCDAEVARLSAEIWGDGTIEGAGERKIGKGRLVPVRFETAPDAGPMPVLYGDFAQVEQLLSNAGVMTDFESDSRLRYTHRRDGDSDIYFVSNPAPRAVEAKCRFRVSGKTAELWDALTGRRTRASASGENAARTAMTLALGPHDSVFVVFRSSSNAAGPQPAPGRLAGVDGPWEVRFQPGRGAPPQLTLHSLMDLSQHPDTTIRHFSGTAVYRTTFPAPPPAGAYVVDLGRVEVVARVRLNGKDLGIAWRPPFRVEAAGGFRPGDNLLEIEVANLWPNRLIGDQAAAESARIAWSTWNPLKADSPLLPSGLIGPVTILTGNGR